MEDLGAPSGYVVPEGELLGSPIIVVVVVIVIVTIAGHSSFTGLS